MDAKHTSEIDKRLSTPDNLSESDSDLGSEDLDAILKTANTCLNSQGHGMGARKVFRMGEKRDMTVDFHTATPT